MRTPKANISRFWGLFYFVWVCTIIENNAKSLVKRIIGKLDNT